MLLLSFFVGLVIYSLIVCWPDNDGVLIAFVGIGGAFLLHLLLSMVLGNIFFATTETITEIPMLAIDNASTNMIDKYLLEKDNQYIVKTKDGIQEVWTGENSRSGIIFEDIESPILREVVKKKKTTLSWLLINQLCTKSTVKMSYIILPKGYNNDV